MPNGKRLDEQHSGAQTQFEALVEKASKGDKDALCELCENVAKSILFQVTYILGRPDGVEDVSQEVLVRLCENIHTLRSPKAFRTWLSRIIINEKNRYLAKNIKQGEVFNIDDYLEEMSEESDDFIPQDYVESKELRQSVMQTIMALPMRQRETIIMHYYDGLSVTEIARTLETTTQSVSKNLAVARGKLKDKLGGNLRGDEQMGAMAALPIGAILGEILQRESVNFAAGEAYIQGFAAKSDLVADTTQMVSAFSAMPAECVTLAGVCATIFAAVAALRVRGRQK